MKHRSDPSARTPDAPNPSDTPDRSSSDMETGPKHTTPPSSAPTAPAETHSFTVDVTETEAPVEAQNPTDRIPGGKRYLLPRLFLTMLKIGLFAFGGGYAMTALLETELVTKRGWLKQDEFLDMTAIAESTPGPSPSIWRPLSARRRRDSPARLSRHSASCSPSFSSFCSSPPC